MLGKLDRPGTESSWWSEACAAWGGGGCGCAQRLLSIRTIAIRAIGATSDVEGQPAAGVRVVEKGG